MQTSPYKLKHLVRSSSQNLLSYSLYLEAIFFLSITCWCSLLWLWGIHSMWYLKSY